MKVSELIDLLQKELQERGDKQVIFAANKHSYYSAKLISDESKTTFALYDKVEE